MTLPPSVLLQADCVAGAEEPVQEAGARLGHATVIISTDSGALERARRALEVP